MKSNLKTAKAVGALFLGGMVAGVVGNMLIQSTVSAPDYLSTLSANSMKLTIGAILMLMTSVWDATHGILMLPVLKQHSERNALGYFGFRIVNSAFLAIQVLFILIQIPLANQYLEAAVPDTSYLQSISTLFLKANVYAYQIAMIFVGLAGTMLCCMFYSAKLVPRFLALWGIIGYVTILCGSVLEVSGLDMRLIHTIPGGLWELFIGVWLIVKGFKPNSIKPKSDNLKIA